MCALWNHFIWDENVINQPLSAAVKHGLLFPNLLLLIVVCVCFYDISKLVLPSSLPQVIWPLWCFWWFENPVKLQKPFSFIANSVMGFAENNFRLGLPNFLAIKSLNKKGLRFWNALSTFLVIWYYKYINSCFQTIDRCYIQTQTAVLKPRLKKYWKLDICINVCFAGWFRQWGSRRGEGAGAMPNVNAQNTHSPHDTL